MPVFDPDASVQGNSNLIKIDNRTDAMLRLFTSKIPDAKISANKIVDETRPPMENAVNVYKGEFSACEFFGVPFGWEILNRRSDGGKDIRVGDSTLKIKTSWWNPCNILLPKRDKKQNINADYVVCVYGEGWEYELLGWITKEEFFRLAKPVEKMKNRPLGVHSSLCHPMHELKAKVDLERGAWGLDTLQKFYDYTMACAKRKADLEEELGPDLPKDLYKKLNDPKYDRIRAMTWPEYSADLVERQRAELTGRKHD